MSAKESVIFQKGLTLFYDYVLQLYFGGFIPLKTWNAAIVSDGVTGRRHLEQWLTVDHILWFKV